MPRAEKTQLVMKKNLLLKQIKILKESVQAKEEQLEEIKEVIRTKGPYTHRNYNLIYFGD